MYTVVFLFYFSAGEKRLVERLKQIEIVVQDSSKSTGISGKNYDGEMSEGVSCSFAYFSLAV